MRNLKKVLSLVLCVAVMLSVMVLGAGAAFSDQDQIENTEAVDMCSVLNIIGGYEDGSFHPERNIKRSEISKMICVALNGGVEPNLSVPATPTFSDVRNTADGWAEKYIESCVAQGIVSGVGGGRFSPAGNVTGSQLAKMLLVAIGYDSDIEKFTGNSWDTNVNVIATQKGLYEGLESMDVSAAVTRDQAAQMVWNAMEAVMVEYTYTLVSENGQLVSKPVVGDKAGDPTLLSEKYKAVTVKGLLTDIAYDDEKGEYTYQVWYDENGNGTVDIGSGEKDVLTTYTTTKDFSNLYMHNVKVMYKMKDNKANVYGITADDSTVLASGVLGDIKDFGSLSSATKLEIDGTEYKLDVTDTSALYVYSYLNIAALADNDVFTSKGATIETYDGTAANATYAFDLIDADDNGKVDYLVSYPYTVNEVTYVGNKSFTISGTVDSASSFEFEKVNAYDGIAKGDYAVVTAKANTMDNKTTFAKADVISGKVTGVKTSEVAIDGTWYKNTGVSVNINDSYDFVVVNGYIFNAELTTETSKNVLFLSDIDTLKTTVGSTTGTVEAKVYIGSEDQIITIEKVDGDEIDSTVYAALKTGLYTYTVNSNNNYEIKNLSSTNKAGYDLFLTADGATYEWDQSAETLANGTKIADDAVVYVVQDDDADPKSTAADTAAITGKQLKSWSGDFGNVKSQALISAVNGINYAKVIVLIEDSALETSTSDLKYAYVVDDANKGPYVGTNDDGDTVKWMTLWTGSEEIVVYVDDETVAVDAGDAISYKSVDDTEINNITVISDTATNKVAITGLEAKAEGNIVYENGSLVDTNKLSDEIVVIGIDSKNKKGAEADLSSISTEPMSETANKLTPNAIISVNGTTVDVIFYDVNNKLDGATEVTDNVATDNASQKANNDKVTAVTSVGATGETLVFGYTNVAGTNIWKINKDLSGSLSSVTTALSDATGITVTVAPVAADDKPTMSGLSGDDYKVVGAGDTNSKWDATSKTVQVLQADVTESNTWTAVQVTVTAADVGSDETVDPISSTIILVIAGVSP